MSEKCFYTLGKFVFVITNISGGKTVKSRGLFQIRDLRVFNGTRTKGNLTRKRFAVSKLDAGETCEAHSPTLTTAETLNIQLFCHFTREGDV